MTVFGWWDWDAETLALVNRVTGECMAFHGKLQDADLVPRDQSWLRFDDLHSEPNFPLLVEERRAEGSKDKGKTFWRIDYCRSNELWRRQSGGKTPHASFGTWRRVDDCVTDAFAFWPHERTAQGALAQDFWLAGSWLNGGWCEGLRRLEQRTSSRDKAPSEDDCDSWFVSLNAPPPSPFVFHDHIPVVTKQRTGR